MMDTRLGRPVRHLVAEELQAEAAPQPRAAGCAMPLLAGFLPVVALGMCIPHVAAAVMGWR